MYNSFPKDLSFQNSEMTKVCLPKFEMEKFDGDVINWNSFLDNFDLQFTKMTVSGKLINIHI